MKVGMVCMKLSMGCAIIFATWLCVMRMLSGIESMMAMTVVMSMSVRVCIVGIH